MAYYDLGLQRKQDIENNLLTLMQESPYDRIAVKDLTDGLRMNSLDATDVARFELIRTKKESLSEISKLNIPNA